MPRLTIRRLMLAVAILAGILGLVGWMQRRASSFRIETVRHYQGWVEYGRADARVVQDPKALYHLAMYEKYRKAADNPWLPVADDPPEPE